MSNPICVRQSNNLLTVDTTHIAGYECTNVWLYILVCFTAIAIQIGQNFIYTKASQATREALHEPQGKERAPYIVRLLWYTFIQMMLYIANILLILGGNLGILGCVLIGTLLGTYLSMKEEKADKARTAIQLTTMVKQYREIDARRNQFPLTPDDQKHWEQLVEAKRLLKEYLNENTVNVRDDRRRSTGFKL